MGKNEKFERCCQFFEGLKAALSATHITVGSCNRDLSSYLIPIGTEQQITYYGKPANSYRISDHWNWKSNLKRCKDEHYVQCFSKDFPWVKRRNGEGLASDPIYSNSVCWFGPDNLYHVIYGEVYDRKTKTWSWIENEVGPALDWCNQFSQHFARS